MVRHRFWPAGFVVFFLLNSIADSAGPRAHGFDSFLTRPARLSARGQVVIDGKIGPISPAVTARSFTIKNGTNTSSASSSSSKSGRLTATKITADLTKLSILEPGGVGQENELQVAGSHATILNGGYKSTGNSPASFVYPRSHNGVGNLPNGSPSTLPTSFTSAEAPVQATPEPANWISLLAIGAACLGYVAFGRFRRNSAEFAIDPGQTLA
jgi:hypothetical protein